MRLLIGINGFIVSTVAVAVVFVVVVVVAAIIDARVVVVYDANPAIAAATTAAVAFVVDFLAGDCDQSPMVKGNTMEDASIAT